MANNLIITTPKGVMWQDVNQFGENIVRLEWNPGFGPQKTRDFQNAQQVIDSECLRYMSPYVPFDTGMLDKSALLHTVIGSGEIIQKTPYAAYQYYETAKSRSYDPRRGAYWFERMKADHKADILRSAAKKAGAEPK